MTAYDQYRASRDAARAVEARTYAINHPTSWQAEIDAVRAENAANASRATARAARSTA